MSFIYSDDNKRYHTLYRHNKHTYGRRVVKAVIDAGFTCPNIDGTKSRGGCLFCSSGSGYFTCSPSVPIPEQIKREKERIHKKYPDALISAYFQAHSNTYADIGTLKLRLYEAINSGIDFISIATRSDCITSETAGFLASLPVPVTVELGLQTIHDNTKAEMNCCHTTDEFFSAMDILRKAKIRTCVHIINGLPGETQEMMLETAKVLGKQRPDAVKIHLLHVIKGTKLCEIYEKGDYTPMTKSDYIDVVSHQLEYLPPETVIERLTGDGDKKTLAAPLWSTDKISVLGGIDKRMKELDIYQGDKFIPDGSIG